MIERPRFVYVGGGGTDDDRELHFPIELAAAARDPHRIVGAGQRGGGLEEDDRLFGQVHAALGRMIPEIQPDADDLARPRNRAAGTRVLRDLGNLPLAFVEPVAQAVRTVRAEKLLVEVPHELRDVEAPSLLADDCRAFEAAIAE